MRKSNYNVINKNKELNKSNHVVDDHLFNMHREKKNLCHKLYFPIMFTNDKHNYDI